MNVDLKLQYSHSCEQIKEILTNDIEKIDRDGGILDMEPFPSPRTLALLARAVYSDGDVVLPEGWKHLTTASNKSFENGYIGAAYLNPSLQQVVVSHRGTLPTNVGALWTNIKGVINTMYSCHMNSAITFADKIMSVVCEVNEEKEAGLQLSVTGHSLGGWLGQVTAFTLQNVRRDRDDFVKMHDRTPIRHAHTVTFDTPGCRDMLEKIIDDSYCRYKKTVSPDELDITNYLAPPNRINTTGPHVGTIHLVYIDVSNFGRIGKHTPYYNVAIHAIDNFVKAFDSKPAAEATREVLDWPVSRGARGGPEYGAFHERVSHKTNYEYTASLAEEEKQQKTWMKELRYKTEKVEDSCNMRVFCESESYLLELWRALKTENVKMTKISAFVTEHSLGTVDDLLADFDIKNRTLICRNKESLRAVVGRTKQLTRWFPGLLGALKRQGAGVPRAGALMYRMEADNYLASLPECRMCFEDIIELERFLESSETRLLHISTEDHHFQVSVVRKLLSQIPQLEHSSTYLQYDRQTFLDWEKMQDLENKVNFVNLYKSGYDSDDLLVIDLPVASEGTRFFKLFLENVNKKLIVISAQQSEHLVRSLDVPSLTKHCEQLTFNDLTEDSKKELFSRKMFISGGKQLALKDYTETQNSSKIISYISNSTANHRDVFQKIITDTNYVIQMDGALSSHDDLRVHSSVNEEVNVKEVARALKKSHPSDTLLVIDGTGRERLRTDLLSHNIGEENICITTGNGESVFEQMCREKPDSTVYWITASEERSICNKMYSKEFYMERQFHKISFNFEKFASEKNIELREEKIILIFLDVKDAKSLTNRYKVSEGICLKSDNFKTAASDKEVDDIIKKKPNTPTYVFKQEEDGGYFLWRSSTGSLVDLRPYVTTDIGTLIKERELRGTSQKAVIIADEPGMGKSTTMTNVSRLLQPSAWVIKIHLKDFSLEDLSSDLSLNSVCRCILGYKDDDWLPLLLHFCLKYEKSRDIFIFFDGFDEIRRDIDQTAEDKVLGLLKYLKNETNARVWVTTRLYRREILENSLSTFATRFERIDENHQQKFLTTSWSPHLLLKMDNYGPAEEKKLDECVKCVYKNAKKVLGEDVENFMGIPLQMRMLAEVCLPRVKDCLNLLFDIENIFDIKNVFDLYKRFIELKNKIYLEEKTRLGEVMGYNDKLDKLKDITEKHRMLAVRTLFPKFAKDYFDDLEDRWGDELCRFGMVQSGGDGNIEFIHRTLAEYYCADLVVERLRNNGRYHGHAPIEEMLLNKILVDDSHRVIRIFTDNFFVSESFHEDARKIICSKMSELWQGKKTKLSDGYHQTALHIAVKEKKIGNVGMLVGGFKHGEKQLIAFLVAQDWDRYTALGRAAQAGDGEIMKQILRSVEKCDSKLIKQLLMMTYMRYMSKPKDEIKVLGDYLEGDEVCREIKKIFTEIKNSVQ